MTAPTAATLSPDLLLRQVIGRKRIRAIYQPIVDLASGTPVAYEALARGPEGSSLEMPGALFGAAARADLLAELDRACRDAAVDGALRAGLRPPYTLFVNVEPSVIGGSEPLLSHEDELAAGNLRVVVEFTERELAARPADVLAAVGWLRERGVGIALDDVGIDERSLALMPFLAPDVIKLDMSLVQQRGTSKATARVLNAVAAEAERSGATLLAEGIETEEHLARARAIGATLGQGWLFGRPGPLAPIPMVADRIRLRRSGTAPVGTPYELIADRRRVRRGDKRLLLALSRQLEAEADSLGGEVVVLATFQDIRFFTPASRDRYERLARSAALVGAVGAGMSAEPAPRVRGADLQRDEALNGEWNVVVISPHFAGAFVALDLGDAGVPDSDRRFDFFVTYERELVTLAAHALMARVYPQRTRSESSP
jgi:EAL domain-containing protein (putative c-di-GMP-specific phosphodiesterase class I)